MMFSNAVVISDIVLVVTIVSLLSDQWEDTVRPKIRPVGAPYPRPFEGTRNAKGCLRSGINLRSLNEILDYDWMDASMQIALQFSFGADLSYRENAYEQIDMEQLNLKFYTIREYISVPRFK